MHGESRESPAAPPRGICTTGGSGAHERTRARAYDVRLTAERLPPSSQVAVRMKAMATAIANVKSSVDTSAPKGFGEMKRNVKKEFVQEERYAEIEAQNRGLLERMSTIMSRPSADMMQSPTPAHARSLNRSVRRKELERITEDNQVRVGVDRGGVAPPRSPVTPLPLPLTHPVCVPPTRTPLPPPRSASWSASRT